MMLSDVCLTSIAYIGNREA